MKIILTTLVAKAAGHGYLSLPMGYRTGGAKGDQSLTDGKDRSWYISLTTCPGFEDQPIIMMNGTEPNCTDGPQPALQGGDDGHPYKCVRTAEVHSPCGRKHGTGQDGREQLDKFGGNKKDYPVYKWKLGEDQEVAWSLAGYHGGYTSYALTPEDQVGPPGDNGRNSKTSKAFDSNVLEFVDNEVCYKQNLGEKGDCKNVEMKDEKYLADGDGQPNQHGNPTIAAVSKVKVPADKYPPGRYVLQWEWDCHHTAQIWQMCVDVEITGEGPQPTPTPPTPEPTPEPTPPAPAPIPTPTPTPSPSGFRENTGSSKTHYKEVKKVKDAESCCEICEGESKCTHWVWESENGNCELKPGKPGWKQASGHTGGESGDCAAEVLVAV